MASWYLPVMMIVSLVNLGEGGEMMMMMMMMESLESSSGACIEEGKRERGMNLASVQLSAPYQACPSPLAGVVCRRRIRGIS